VEGRYKPPRDSDPHCGGGCFQRADSHEEEVLVGLKAGEGEVVNNTAPEGEWLASAMTENGGYGEVPPASIGGRVALRTNSKYRGGNWVTKSRGVFTLTICIGTPKGDSGPFIFCYSLENVMKTKGLYNSLLASRFRKLHFAMAELKLHFFRTF
jgi:hypothetical protein